MRLLYSCGLALLLLMVSAAGPVSTAWAPTGQRPGLSPPALPSGQPSQVPPLRIPAAPFAEPMATVSDPPPKEWAKAPLLQEAVGRAMAGFAGDYSVVVQDLESGERWIHNPDRRYHPASTIKMPVVLYALEQYRAGKVGWQDLIEYTPADFESPGGGAFEQAPFGGLYPIENLVNRALQYSNNVAVNMLGRHFGWANIEAWTMTIGGDLHRVNDRPEVTALSELGWWLHLHRIASEDPQSVELLLKPLRQVVYDGRIAAGLPKGVDHLHKFGSYDGNYHDSGIVYAERPYILIVLTHGADEAEADEAIARLSREVYRIMTAEPSRSCRCGRIPV